MQKLLSDAKYKKVQSERFRKYVKSGDVNTALNDFHSAQPINVQRKTRFSFGRGKVGDVSYKEQKTRLLHECKDADGKICPSITVSLRKYAHAI